MAGEKLERPPVQRGVSTVSQGTPARPTVQRGVSTVSQVPPPSRPVVQRAVSTASGRPPIQRGVSTVSKVSAKSGSPEVKPEEAKAALKRRFMSIAGHFVLIFMLAVYSAAGGFAFVQLEKPNEIKTHNTYKERVQNTKEILIQRVWNFTRGNLLQNCENLNLTLAEIDIRNILEEEVLGYTELIYNASDDGVNVQDHKEPKIHWDSDFLNWNYPRSMFFSATVITTIGYGNIAPVTLGGRVFCIIYALVGIPLTLIAVGDMGKLFASLLQFIYKKIKKRVKARAAARQAAHVEKMKLKELESTKSTSGAGAGSQAPLQPSDATAPPDTSKTMTSVKVFGAIFLLLLYIAMGGGMFILWENWTFFESFYFCFITMTTIGLGDLVPEHQMFMLLCTVYILIGLALTSTCIELARSEYEKSWQRMIEASKRIQTLSALSFAESLKRIGDQIEHGEIVDLNLIKEMKCAILGEMPPEDKPPPILIYETSV